VNGCPDPPNRRSSAANDNARPVGRVAGIPKEGAAQAESVPLTERLAFTEGS
jgi:hypothetical protein